MLKSRIVDIPNFILKKTVKISVLKNSPSLQCLRTREIFNNRTFYYIVNIFFFFWIFNFLYISTQNRNCFLRVHQLVQKIEGQFSSRNVPTEKHSCDKFLLIENDIHVILSSDSILILRFHCIFHVDVLHTIFTG
jgi:hypothetical protein